MSTGKRLAKRSIIGTRICAPVPVGGVELYMPAVISATKNTGIGADPQELNTVYTVTFSRDQKWATSCPASAEYRANELIGPGFGSVSQAKLLPGQRVFITYSGREVAGTITAIDDHEVQLALDMPASKDSLLSLSSVKRRRDEIRLLESRKSARLADSDTPDFFRLANGNGMDGGVGHAQDQPMRARTSSIGSLNSVSSTSTCDLPLTK